MDEIENQNVEDQNQNQDYNEPVENEDEEFEMGFTDKLVGVFSSPTETFAHAAKFPPKTSDWLIPIFGLIIVVVLSNFLMLNNPIIKQELQEKQLAKVEKNFDKMVEAGTLTQEKADEQLEKIQDGMEAQMGGGVGQIFQVVGAFFGIFIFFFILAGIYFLFAKFALHGEGSYQSALVAYGLPTYIAIVATIVKLILALTMNQFMTDTSIASIIGSDASTFMGFILGKLDIFGIWGYVVISIAFAKMFKSESTGKYYGMIFGLWIGFGLLFFYLAKAVPMLGMFSG